MKAWKLLEQLESSLWHSSWLNKTHCVLKYSLKSDQFPFYVDVNCSCINNFNDPQLDREHSCNFNHRMTFTSFGTGKRYQIPTTSDFQRNSLIYLISFFTHTKANSCFFFNTEKKLGKEYRFLHVVSDYLEKDNN